MSKAGFNEPMLSVAPKNCLSAPPGDTSLNSMIRAVAAKGGVIFINFLTGIT